MGTRWENPDEEVSWSWNSDTLMHIAVGMVIGSLLTILCFFLSVA